MLNFNHSASSFNLLLSFIAADENILGMSGSEAFSFGDENLNHVFGFDYMKSINDETKLFFEYRHLKSDESNNNLGILRNFRNLAQNSFALGFKHKLSQDDLVLSIYYPPAFVSGDVDVDVAIGRTSSSIIRAQDTIDLTEQNRQVNYSLSFDKKINKNKISLQYSFIDNFNHEDSKVDQLLFLNFVKEF